MINKMVLFLLFLYCVSVNAEVITQNLKEAECITTGINKETHINF